MYPRDVMHVWPVPDYEITARNPWARAFQRWAPLYVLLAASMYTSYDRQSDGHPWPFNDAYQLVGVFLLVIHGVLFGTLLSIRQPEMPGEPEPVADSSPEATRARLNDLGKLAEPRWRTSLLAALERCTHEAVRRSLEFELATRSRLPRLQNDALDLSTELISANTAKPLRRAMGECW